MSFYIGLLNLHQHKDAQKSQIILNLSSFMNIDLFESII